MERGLLRFEVLLNPRMRLSLILLAPAGLIGGVPASAVGWLLASMGVSAIQVALLSSLAFGCAVFIFYQINPPRIVLGVDGILVPRRLRPALLPWVGIQAVTVEQPSVLLRKGSVLVLRLTDGRALRFPTAVAPEGMARVRRVIAARLGATRPPLPGVLPRIETSSRPAEALLAAPQGLAYKNDGLSPEGWWRVFEAEWALPYERVAAAMALGSQAQLQSPERAELVMASLASGPLCRLVRQAFVVNDPARADGLLQRALELGGTRLERPRPTASRWTKERPRRLKRAR